MGDGRRWTWARLRTFALTSLCLCLSPDLVIHAAALPVPVVAAPPAASFPAHPPAASQDNFSTDAGIRSPHDVQKHQQQQQQQRQKQQKVQKQQQKKQRQPKRQQQHRKDPPAQQHRQEGNGSSSSSLRVVGSKLRPGAEVQAFTLRWQCLASLEAFHWELNNTPRLIPWLPQHMRIGYYHMEGHPNTFDGGRLNEQLLLGNFTGQSGPATWAAQVPDSLKYVWAPRDAQALWWLAPGGWSQGGANQSALSLPPPPLPPAPAPSPSSLGVPAVCLETWSRSVSDSESESKSNSSSSLPLPSFSSFDAPGFCSALRRSNGSFFIVGDSMSALFTMALIAELKTGGVPVRELDPSPACLKYRSDLEQRDHRWTLQRRPRRGGAVRTKLRPCYWWLVCGNGVEDGGVVVYYMLTCHLQWIHRNVSQEYYGISSDWCQHFNTFFWGEEMSRYNVSVMLLNRGAHFVPDRLFEAQLNYSLQELRRLFPKALIVFRSSSAGHSNCTNFTRPREVPILEPEGPFHWHEIPEQNVISRRLVVEVDGVFLDIAPMTSLRPDWHIDCLHYKVPGPPNDWARFFGRMLQELL